MNIKVFIFSVLVITANFQTTVTQSLNIQVTSDIQTLLSNTQISVRAYLSTILVDSILQNVDAIFAAASSNVTTIINKNYNCARLTTTTTSTTTATTSKTTITSTTTTSTSICRLYLCSILNKI